MRRELPGKERLDVECHASAPFQHANTFVQNVLHSGEISQQRLYSIPKLYGGEVTIMSTQLSGIRHSTSQQSPQTIVFDKSQAVPRLSARMTTSGYKNRTVPFLHLQKFSNLRGKISVILHAPVQAACFEKMAATPLPCVPAASRQWPADTPSRHPSALRPTSSNACSL